MNFTYYYQGKQYKEFPEITLPEKQLLKKNIEKFNSLTKHISGDFILTIGSPLIAYEDSYKINSVEPDKVHEIVNLLNSIFQNYPPLRIN